MILKWLKQLPSTNEEKIRTAKKLAEERGITLTEEDIKYLTE
ncbi:MAG: hypothetical protein QXW39_07370 [Candidatus Bathyarchaeia archaeon]